MKKKEKGQHVERKRKKEKGKMQGKGGGRVCFANEWRIMGCVWCLMSVWLAGAVTGVKVLFPHGQVLAGDGLIALGALLQKERLKVLRAIDLIL